MPAKVDKLVIKNTIYDRRFKLTLEDKNRIIQLYQEGQSLRSLGREFNVDKKTIKNTVDPITAEKSRLESIENSKKYRERVKQSTELKQKISQQKKMLRLYKSDLHQKGLI